MPKPVPIQVLNNADYLQHLKKRWLKKVNICTHGIECRNCCWLWTARKDGYGYGTITIYRKQRQAHRIGWTLFNNQEFPDGLQGNHIPICSSKACVQPAHTYPGDHVDNQQDFIYTEHAVLLYGKPSLEQVTEMRKLRATQKLSYDSIAELFGVSCGVAWRAINAKGYYAAKV